MDKCYCWGINIRQQLGIGNKINQLTPIINEGLSNKNIIDIIPGGCHSIVIINQNKKERIEFEGKI